MRVHIGKKAFRPNHPDIGLSLINLGQLFRKQGRFSEGWDPARTRARHL
jgi:hypothetical protein